MAKHFKEDVEKTTVATRRRPAASPQQRTQPQARPARARVSGASGVHPTYGDPAPYRTAYPKAAPRRDFYLEDDEPVARGGIRAFGRGVFLLLAWVVRIVALALFVLVMLNSFPIPPIRYSVAFVTDTLTQYLPWCEWGVLTVDTPFGGIFRCDLFIASFLLFVVDWLLCRIRAALA